MIDPAEEMRRKICASTRKEACRQCSGVGSTPQYYAGRQHCMWCNGTGESHKYRYNEHTARWLSEHMDDIVWRELIK